MTLIVECRVDTFTSQELDREINDEQGNFNSLIMDFTNLEYFSSSRLRVLIVT
ncbi:STAS domain-containing protein [Methanobrevibacter sp.]